MAEHTLRVYDRQLARLTETILGMSERIEFMLEHILRAINAPTEELAAEARAADKEVNAMERAIEQQVNELLALRNPMAIDLRYITSSSKIAASLERMGDLAKNTVRQLVPLAGVQDAGLRAQYQEMHKLCISMLHDALHAFTHLDAPKATKVWHLDDKVDDLCDTINARLVEFMRAHPEKIERYMELMFASKNLERIADYAAKIAKIVHYVTSGKPATKAMLKAEASAMLAAQTVEA